MVHSANNFRKTLLKTLRMYLLTGKLIVWTWVHPNEVEQKNNAQFNRKILSTSKALKILPHYAHVIYEKLNPNCYHK